ncbi:MAG: apolipoprotein N-acyltransferase [Candidatus Accumulibacter sp.]|jgi:apolipoprotein N-acyltransferase|nr:apolipoprotein N-acyltransferase [Accumulibacter sp.]
MTRTLARPALAAFLLGAASVAAFEPVGFYPLIFPTLAGLFGLLDAAASRKTSFRGGALLGGAFGFGLFIAGVSWIFVSLSTFGNMPAPLAAFATFLFCLVESLFPALAGALFVRFAPESKLGRVLFFAALWTLAEVLRGSGSFGFPWLTIGYSQTPPSPLAAFAPIVGVYGVSLVVALAAAPLSEIARGVFARSGDPAEMPPPLETCNSFKTCRCRPFLPFLAIIAAGTALRPIEWSAPTGAPLKLAIAQGNIAQEMKWRPEHFHETLRVFLRLVEENPAQLTILPEAAFPAFLDQIPRDYITNLSALARREAGGLIVGIPTRESEERPYNSAILLGAPGKNAAVKYDKSHLVPFGEFVPPGFKWFLELVDIPMSNFASGAQKQPILRVGDQRIAVNICYEDAFGAEIVRALPEATLLVNLSNVAWFGDSLAPAQHLQISQMRALETGRTMLRATNTGMTAIIGPDGRVVKRLAPFTRDVLRGEAQGYAGTTPFVRWGNWLVIAIALVMLYQGTDVRRRETEKYAAQSAGK